MPVLPAAAQPVPARLFHDGEALLADWVDIADTDPTLPFLHDRIARAGSVWRAALPAASGEARPSALVLHAGRCGSTWVSRALSHLSRCHVLSEPQVVNDVLGVDGVWPFMPHGARVDALRQVIAALTRSARSDQDRVILKLSSWNALHLPLIEEAFPDVPKLFVYRQPDEILVSLRDAPAGWMRRAGDPVQTKLFLGSAAPAGRDPLAFAAQALGRIFAMVADAASKPGAAGRWLLIPYAGLPEAVNGQIPGWLGLQPSAAEAQRIVNAAATHAKDAKGVRRFEPDGERKRAAVTPELAELAERFANAHYHRLDRFRLAGAAQ